MNKKLINLMLIMGIILLFPIEGQAKLHFGVISLVKEKIDELKGSISGKVVVKSEGIEVDIYGICNGRYCLTGTLTPTNLDGISVILYSNGREVKSTTVVGNSYKFTGVAPDEYTVKAKVTDEIWNTNETSSIKVTSGESIAGPTLEFEKSGSNPLYYSVCYPNPVREGQDVIFERLAQQTTIRIFNLKGEKIREFIADGMYVWDCKDSLNEDVPSGVYFYKLTSSPPNDWFISNLIIER